MYNKLGIIGAMDSEISRLIADMPSPKKTEISGITFYEGTLYGKNVVLAKSGVGKVFAAVCAEIMIEKFKVDALINTGIAGNVKGLNVLDTVVSTKVVQHDMDTSAVGDPVGLISGINVVYIDADEELINSAYTSAQSFNNAYKGIIASGDQVVADKGKKAEIYGKFQAVCCEMEGGAIGQVAYINKVPFVVIRTISDGGENGVGMEYAEFKVKASDISYNVVKKMLCGE